MDPVDMQGSTRPMQARSNGSLDGVAGRNHLQSEEEKTTCVRLCADAI